MSDESDEIENSYNCGVDDGYASGVEDTTKHFESKIDDLEYEHNKKIERSYKDGYEEAENLYDRLMTNMQQEFNSLISTYRTTIKSLREQNYELRKENATITRSVQKST